LFPLLLRVFILALGEGSVTIIFLQSLFTYLGIILLALTVKQIAGPVAAACNVVLLGLYPDIIGYSHVLLTEAGTFFFISLCVYTFSCLITESRSSISATLLAAGVISLGYYHRQTIIYMLPLFMLLLVLRYAWTDEGKRPSVKSLLKTGVPFALLLAVFCYFLVLPWKTLEKPTGFRNDVILHGLAKQAVVDPDSPMMSHIQDHYRAAIKRASTGGFLSLSGLLASDTRPVFQHLRRMSREDPNTIRIILRQNPDRYLKGVIRTTLYFLGLRGLESQIALWSDYAYSSDYSLVTGNHPHISARLKYRTTGGVFSSILHSLADLFRFILIPLGAISTLIMLIYASKVRVYTYFVTSAVPFMFLGIHSLTCLTIDRYVLPVYPLILSNLVLCVVAGWSYLHRGRSQRLFHASTGTAEQDSP